MAYFFTIIHNKKSKKHIVENAFTSIVDARQFAIEKICWKSDRYATILKNGKVIEKLENYYNDGNNRVSVRDINDGSWAGIRSIVNGKIKYDVTADGTVLKWKGLRK